MSDQPNVNLKTLLEESGLLEEAQEIDESMYNLQVGSAVVVVGIKGRALVIISPMFKTLPEGREAEFCFRLLQLNSALGGIANFAIQPDGWVVMHGGRDVKGMDADEFGTLVGAVSQAADHFDNLLLDEFYSTASDDDSGAEGGDGDGGDDEAGDDGSEEAAAEDAAEAGDSSDAAAEDGGDS